MGIEEYITTMEKQSATPRMGKRMEQMSWFQQINGMGNKLEGGLLWI